MTEVLLALRGLSKSYGDKKACWQVDFDLKKGSIHGLLGENGAGKSTLVKMIGGFVRPDAGTILWEGKPVTIKSPLEGRRLGIGMVFQHFSLFDALTVAENVVLGLPKDWRDGSVDEKIRSVSENYGLGVDPSRYMHNLTVGERQRVEIVRSLIQEPKLLVMDEPTSVLTPQEATRLMKILRHLAEEGCGILYISHRLIEIEEMCDEATIMRWGEVVDRVIPKEETALSMASKMMGEEFAGTTKNLLDAVVKSTPPMLVLDNLSCDDRPLHDVPLRGVSLEVRPGEVVGIAGLAGNGQDLFGAALSGEVGIKDKNSVRFFGEPVGHLGVVDRRLQGLGYIPEDRQGHSVLLNFDLVDNGVLGADSYQGLWKGNWLQHSQAIAFSNKIVEEYDVRCLGVFHQASSLSGGNLQKFVLGRVLKQQPKIVLAMQPTWGLDVGAALLIHQCLLNLAKAGCGIIVVSQDIEELMSLTQRIGVLFEGHLSQTYETSTIKVEEIGLLMGGLTLEDA